MPHRQLKVKTTAPRVKIIAHLEELIRALKTGNMTLSNRQEVIALYPGEVIGFSLEAEATLEKHALREKLILQLKWERKAKAAWDIKPVTQRSPTERCPGISITSLNHAIADEQENYDNAKPFAPPAAADQTSLMHIESLSAPADISGNGEEHRQTDVIAKSPKATRHNRTEKQPAPGRKKRPRTISVR